MMNSILQKGELLESYSELCCELLQNKQFLYDEHTCPIISPIDNLSTVNVASGKKVLVIGSLRLSDKEPQKKGYFVLRPSGFPINLSVPTELLAKNLKVSVIRIESENN